MKLYNQTFLKILLIIGCLSPLIYISQANAGEEVTTSSKLAPIADTWISSELPDSNFGTENRLTVSTFGANYIKGWFKEAFFLFDVSQFSCHSTAQFAIFTLNPKPIVLKLLTSGTVWGEDSLTWNTRPSLFSTIVNSILSTNNTYVYFNITSLFISVKNSMLSLVVEAQTNNYNGTYILSKENTLNGPYLACVTSQGVTLDAVIQNNWADLTNNPSIFYGTAFVICISCYVLYSKKIKQK